MYSCWAPTLLFLVPVPCNLSSHPSPFPSIHLSLTPSILSLSQYWTEFAWNGLCWCCCCIQVLRIAQRIERRWLLCYYFVLKTIMLALSPPTCVQMQKWILLSQHRIQYLIFRFGHRRSCTFFQWGAQLPTIIVLF